MFAHLGGLAAGHPDGLHSVDINRFEVDGMPVRLVVQPGIRKPRFLDAALTIRTTYTQPGQLPPYEDALGRDGFVRYKYRGLDPLHPDNRAPRLPHAVLDVPAQARGPAGCGAYPPGRSPAGASRRTERVGCKIHHAAYDRNILGVRPDLRVEVRADILREIDGPMLRHGLQEMNGRTLTIPSARSSRPDPASLDERYELFRLAG